MSSLCRTYNSKNLTDRDFLCKYCYLTNNAFKKQELQNFFKTCKNNVIIKFCYHFMIYGIMPYYYINRTFFNKIRNCFMEALYTILIEEEDFNNLKYLYELYTPWCLKNGIENDVNCLKTYKTIVSS